MYTYRLVLLGFGAVGQGFARLLRDKADDLRVRYQFGAQIVGVYTRRASLFDPTGLDTSALLHAAQRGGLSAYPGSPKLRRDLDAAAMIAHPEADTLILATPTDLADPGPAVAQVKRAFQAGKNVITVNKAPIATAYPELSALAKDAGLFFGYEGVVMGGTPAVRLAQEALAGSRISEIRGVINGTTNYMLSRMEAGASYAEALAEAQAKGYAETDPTADVEGYDAAGKLIILIALLFGQTLRLDQMDCHGITEIGPQAIAEASAAGERWKLIASARLTDGKVEASVKPIRLPLSDPLAGVEGIMNAVTYVTEEMGGVTLTGAGAGGVPTGFAVLSDLLALHRKRLAGAG